MVSKAVIVLIIGLLGMVYQATQPPAPKSNDYDSVVDDEENGFMVSTRIQLSDGRFLAYRESGVTKDKAKHSIIVVHGFGSSKDMNFPAPQELIDELGVYILHYDRAGYGQSDPNPKRSLKSEALDIEELADQLQIGSKFRVIGVSMGSYATWSCLNYIPNRLAGVAMIAPTINYEWPSLPQSLVRDDYRRKLIKIAMWLARYSPTLLHWWVSQKWLPSNSVIEKNPAFFNKRDIEILERIPGFPMLTKEKLRHEVVYNTLRGDWMTAFGNWEFDPMKLSNPFPQNNRSSVHIWQGYEDKVVPSQIQRFISEKLPWIQYHEVVDGGHLIVHYSGLGEAILKALLLGEEDISYKPRSSSISVS
uniref:AB hydrolase-1 domain-containing protein n=1 Tax=Medicago truncatula TaxID=3880 RepID=I3S3E3_MEDTR|nr:unknown [Medicago truncatula]